MAYFSSQELAAIKNDMKPKAKAPVPKTRGRGGFLTSLISEAGGAGGALGGAALGTALLPGVGTVIGAGLGGLLGGTGGRVAENEVRDSRVGLGDALKEGALSGVAGAGPLRLGKAGIGAIKGARAGTGALEGASEQVGKSFLGKVTGKVGDKAGQRLTEAGSGLKADPNVGGVARLEDNANFMTKYVGSPRQQRVGMEASMKDLSKGVDDILAKTPKQLDGSLVGQRLKAATEDLTDERYLDLDLNNPSVSKIIDRYSQKFSKAQDAKGINDIVKTLNKTATRAQNKLVDEKAGALTAQEQAALALKRAGDDVLSDIPEIAPLKKQMAQIFEVTPQVAKQAEKGLTAPMTLGGVKFKTPVQAANSAQSRLGARLQGVDPGSSTGGILGKVLGASALDTPIPDQMQPDEVPPEAADPAMDANIGGQAVATTADDVLGAGTGDDTDPYSPANVQATVKSILAQGGTQKDVSEYLANVKSISALSGSGGNKPLNSTASGVVADTKTGLASLGDLANQIGSSSANNPIVGRIRGANPFDTDAQSLQASIATTKQIVGKALEGGVLRKEDEAKYAKLLPTMGDTDETAQHKIRQLTALISGRLQEYTNNISGGSGGTDLAELGL